LMRVRLDPIVAVTRDHYREIQKALEEAVANGQVQGKETKVKKHAPGHLLLDDNVLANKPDGMFRDARLQWTDQSLDLIVTDR